MGRMKNLFARLGHQSEKSYDERKKSEENTYKEPLKNSLYTVFFSGVLSPSYFCHFAYPERAFKIFSFSLNEDY